MIIDLSVEIPSLPSNWKGSPDDLLQFLATQGVFHLDGAFPSGQIGGPRPTADVGVWYGDESIERYINGKYRTISDVPIGGVIMFAGTGGVSPTNYLFCTGQILLRADYPELFAVIGVNYNLGSDPDTSFRMPDYRGRVAVGAGVGDYIYQGITGKMREIVAGKYSGREWIQNIQKAPGAPKATKVIPGSVFATGASTAYTEAVNPRIGQQFIIRYR